MSAIQISQVEETAGTKVIEVVVSDTKPRAYRLAISATHTTVYALYANRLTYGKTFHAGDKYQNPESDIPKAYKRDGRILAEVIAEARK